MSTLRISNIEAKSVPASATIDEKVKITNSSGDPLVFIDGKTSGITTVGINTTDSNITFDANSNVVVTGIITATRFSGEITPTSLEIGSNIKLGNAGVITATSFVGSGANLTNLPAQVNITGNADNRVITGGSGTNLNGESNLTFETATTGGTLTVAGTSEYQLKLKDSNSSGNGAETALAFTDSGDTIQGLVGFNYWGDGNLDIQNNNSGGDVCINTGGGNERLRIRSNGEIQIGSIDTPSASRGALAIKASTDAQSVPINLYLQESSGGEGYGIGVDGDGDLNFYNGGATSPTLEIRDNNNVAITDGNLVLASGHGIDFSATSDGSSVSNKSEILDDYEEGSFTPIMSVEGQGSNASLAIATGLYTKVGSMVSVWIEVQFNGTPSGRSTSNAWQFSNLPFTSQPYTVPPSGLRDYRFSMIAMNLDTSSTYGSNGHFVFRLFDNSSAGRIEWQHSDLTLKNASLFIQNTTMIQIHACYPDF